jgi:hypothetical protein
MDETQGRIAQLVEANVDELRKPGVLSVRPGYQVTNGWLTGRPAIVVTVSHKLPGLTGPAALPTHIDGVAVDVRQASPAKRDRILDPEVYDGAARTAPDQGRLPEFPDELDLVASPTAHHLAPFAAPTATKPNLPYTAPDGASLSPVTGDISLTLSASPDSGWPTLKPFLDATKAKLIVSMYDFTSAHILTEVEHALPGKEFKLTLDHPAKNPTANQTDEQTVAALDAALGTTFDQAWALERMDPKATAWIYPTAYHIKVAVQDSNRMWLSSGNWNNSNQPDINPVTTASDATAARSGDRDWHVVIEHPGLSQTFEAFMLHDLEVASAHNAADAASGLESAAAAPNIVTPPFAKFFPALAITGRMTITPVLTPDPGVYVDAVKTLIESATTTLHMQFQYIELPSSTATGVQGFIDLVDAVIARQKAGVEVQIIMSEYETTGYLEQLQAAGLDVATSARIQNNVHNKGIIVDGASVLISSQNWSSAGTLHNRDAGVIIENVKVAEYYEQLFQHDWTTLATQKASDD